MAKSLLQVHASLLLHNTFQFFSFATIVFLVFPSGLSQSTDPFELQALFDVIYSINSENDWKTRLSDPCMGNQQGIYCLPDDVGGMYHVTNLEFGFVSEWDELITCSDDAVLHPSIAKLPFLQSLSMFNCFVNGTATIPKEIGYLSSSLQMLTLLGNSKLSGPIPGELGNLTSLQRLVLTENSLVGTIPAELGNMSSLLQLDLSGNRFYGVIPETFNGLESLVIMNLGENMLSGNLPSLGALGKLQQLVVGNNNISGVIPEDFGNLSSLTYLDLSRNCLTGGIPSSFRNLTKLEDLFLESNNMQSPLPDFIGSMVGLLRLSLSNSGYVGEIPKSFGGLDVNLHVLMLDGNELSGQIPLTLGVLPHIYQLNLSANLLTGPVPFTPAFVKKLGTNLLVRNNSGLCMPAQTLQETEATMGVIICNQSNSLDTSGSESHPPLVRPGPGIEIMDSKRSYASHRSGKVTGLYWKIVMTMCFWVIIGLLNL